MGPSQTPQPPLCPPAAARLLISPAAEVVEGQAVTLSCRSGLSPGPDTRFSWYLNGALLLEGPGSSLLLPAASSSDAGSYHCRAQDGHGASGPSMPAVLTVLREWQRPATACCGEGRPRDRWPPRLFRSLGPILPRGTHRRVVAGLATVMSPPRAEVGAMRLGPPRPPCVLASKPSPLVPPLKATISKGPISRLCSLGSLGTPNSYRCAHALWAGPPGLP